MSVLSIQAALRAVRPRLLVVADRHLIRLINRRRDRGIPIARALDLIHQFDQAELEDDDHLGELVTGQPAGAWWLVLEPQDLGIENLPSDQQLRFYWRMLFSDTVEAHLTGRQAVPEAADAAELAEAKSILLGDGRAAETESDVGLWRKYLALASTRAIFEPLTLPLFYPMTTTAAAFCERWSPIIPFHDISVETRPKGAADITAILTSHTHEAVRLPLSLVEFEHPSDGNLIRLAITKAKAGDLATAYSVIHRLVKNLGPIVGWTNEEHETIARELLPVAVAAAADRNDWPQSRRMLADLQTLSLDLAGELYHVDLPGAMLSFGKKAVRRKMTIARHVLLVRKLKSALNHLSLAKLNAADEHPIHDRLHHDIERAEVSVRNIIGPILEAALEKAGINAVGTVEIVARDAVVQNWLDTLCDRGFLRFADARDAIAKYDLKLPDLAGLKEWWAGDALLRLDKILKGELDSIYHAAEVYLRWFQRGSSLGFGNRVGRFATKYFILPLLGSYLILESIQHVAVAFLKIGKWMSKILAPKPKVVETIANVETRDTPAPPPEVMPADPDAFDPFDFEWDLNPGEAVTTAKQILTSVPTAEAETTLHLVNYPSVIGVALWLLALIISPQFRSWNGTFFRGVWRGLVFVLHDGPIAVWNSNVGRALRNHPISRMFYRRFSTAAVLGVACAVVMLLLGAKPRIVVFWSLILFAFISILIATRFGRWLEDRTSFVIDEGWRIFRVNFLMGIVTWCLWIYRELLGTMERWLYAVDEYFRFRGNTRESSVMGKAILSLLWFPVAYVIRFTFYLLVEPQVNPIKHFPVVTVSHKVLLPTIPWFSETLNISKGIVLGVIWCVPGIFGFLAWEFMANWRLYRASRSRHLRPLAIGHHGESIRTFLRPGFHSGTVPKLFRTMRRNVRKAERAGQPIDRHRFDHDREHIHAAVGRFVDRQLIDLLAHTPIWSDAKFQVMSVETTIRTIAVEVAESGQAMFGLCWTLDGETISRALTLHSAIPADRRAVLDQALAGLDARAGVEATVEREAWMAKWG